MRMYSIARIGTLFAILLIAPLAVTAAFPDVTANPNKTAIEYLSDHGVIGGYADGFFHPERTINRAELLKILIGSVGVQASVAEFHDCFPDVKEEWFAPYVCYAKKQGWIKGYEDGMFRPGLPVNTAEAITMIVNTYGYETMQSSSAAPFNDVDPSAWYASSVWLARAAGILDATNGRLGIAENITRGRVSDFIARSMRSREGTNTKQTTSTGIQGVLKAINHRRGGGGTRAEANATQHNASSSVPVLSSPTITLSDILKTFGDTSFSLTAASNSDGDISYTSGDTNVATIAGTTVTIVGAGTTTITVTQAATGQYTAGGTTASLTVSKANSSLTLTSSSGAIQFSTSLRFTAVVTSGATGTISFYTGATLLGTGLISHGSGSYTTTTLKRGTGSITAVYAGDTNFNGSTSNTLLQKIYNNACLSVVCQHGGTCTNSVNTYSCNCAAPYTGSRCELSYSFCTPAYGGTQCFNGGTCLPSVAGGECQCAACYTGTYCDTYQADICA